MEGINLKLCIPLDSKDYLFIKAWTTLKQWNHPALTPKLKNLLKHSLTVLSCTVISLVTLSPAPVKAEPPDGRLGWIKLFEDTFKKGFDNRKWNKTFWWGNGFVGGDAVSYFSPSNVWVANGQLSLEANKSNTGLPYTGGVVTTYKKFYQTYGYFEAQIEVPKGGGLGPAFSLSPEDTSWPPEINIMEIPGARGNDATTTWMTIHYIDPSINTPNTKIKESWNTGSWTASSGFDTDYHTYGILWQPGLLVWYVDDVERYRTTIGVPDKPCYIILVSGVNNDDGRWAGSPINTIFPQYMSIRWVRAWKPSGS